MKNCPQCRSGPTTRTLAKLRKTGGRLNRAFAEIGVFAAPLAELIAPPTMRHHAETPATMMAYLMLADFRLAHHALARQFDGISLR
jgi:hypothetical protein